MLLFRVLPILFLLIAIQGCSPSVNDGFTRNKRLDLHQGTTNRFNEIKTIGKSAHQFLKAELDNNKIEKIFDQLMDAVILLENYVEGRSKNGGYEPSDLRWFLQTQVLNNRGGRSKLVVRDQLIVEFFNLKASFLGGSPNFISKREMREIVVFLKMLKTQAVLLNPHMKFYNWSNSESLFSSNEEVHEGLNEAQEQLRKSAKVFGEFIQRHHGAKYFFKSFEILLKEIRIMIGWKAAEEVRSVQDYRAFFSLLKEYSVAGDPSSVKSKEWVTYIQRSVEVYNLFLTYVFTVKGKNKTSNDHKYFDKMVMRVFSLLNHFLDKQPDQQVSFKSLGKSIDILDRMNLLGRQIRPSTLKKIIPHVVNKIFAVPNIFPVSRREASHFFTKIHLDEIKKEYLEWHRIQKELNEEVSNLAASHSDSYKFTSDPFVELNDLSVSTFKFSRLMARNDPLRRIVTEVRPFYKNGLRHLWVAPKRDLLKHEVKQNYYNLSQMNLFRSLLRVFARGYVNEEWRYKGLVGATRDELRQAISDFRPLAQDLHLLHPDAKDPGGRIFMEANLFTFSGDGINDPSPAHPKRHLLSYREGLEQLGFVFSAYEVTSKNYEELKKICKLGPLDIFNLPGIDYKCYRKNMKKMMVKSLSHLPGMHAFISELSEKDSYSLMGLFSTKVNWETFSEMLIDSVLKEEEDEHRWIDYTATGKVVMILHYMESLLVVHDSNHDGVLSKNEVLKGKDKFFGIIKELSRSSICKIKKEYKDDPEEMNKKIRSEVETRFKFLLANRYVPTTWWSRNISQYWDGAWSWANSWKMKVSRFEVAEIFKSIYKFILSQKGNKEKMTPQGCPEGS